MTTIERLKYWKDAGIITDGQHRMLSALVLRERVSLFLELNALLYLGVLSLVGGLAWTFSTHFETLGDAFILSVLTLLLGGCLHYVFSRAPAYSNEQTESPNFTIDYILYLACLLLSAEFGYIEFRFEWLKDAWHNYLLFSSIVFSVLAYRFDNRFVLSLALSSLAGWFVIRISNLEFVASSLRTSALIYAFVIAVTGAFVSRLGIKKHFLETYLHIAANVTFIALISGVSGANKRIFMGALVLVSAASIVLGMRSKRFAFVVYGIVFGYIGVSIEAVRALRELSAVLAYLVVTGAGVILLVILLARRVRSEE